MNYAMSYIESTHQKQEAEAVFLIVITYMLYCKYYGLKLIPN